MTSVKRSVATSALAKEVKHWLQAEAGDEVLQGRVSIALDEIRDFVSRHLSDLEKRKTRLIQTTGFKDETRSMEAALGRIRLLLAGGRNISMVYSAIDGFLDTYQEDETFDREHVRTQLADAREEFFCRFHDSIRGTRLSELLDVLYFMPYAYWRPRSVERRNFRSPSAAEVTKLLEDFRLHGIDVDSLDTVTFAAAIRIRLGITPRMNYHLMPANKIAEKLTSEEIIARYASGMMPLDEAFCRTAAGILANIRRWSTECFGTAFPQAPPEIEAEMVQLVYLASDILRIGGTEHERAADYLWLLATVVASDLPVLKDILNAPVDKYLGHPSVRERMVGARSYLGEIAARADEILAARWASAKEELGSLTVRTEAITSKSRQDFGEFTELEGLKERRSDVVKSLIKISDAILLLEPSLLERAPSPETPAGRLPNGERRAALDPARLRDRNFRNSEETKAIARQELEKLRLLILSITAISRRGFAGSGASPSQQRPGGELFARRTSDGVEIAALATAELHAKLCGSLEKAALSLREFKSKVEGVRRRILKSDLQHALNVLFEKMRKAVETCESSGPDAGDPSRTFLVADSLLALLRDIMMAQTGVGARMNTAKLAPAEKQPLTALMNAMKLRLGEDLRDIERMQTVLAERSAGTASGACVEAEAAEVDAPAGAGTAADGADLPPAAASKTAGAALEDAARTAAADKIADLVSAANGALKPVKVLMSGLNNTLACEPCDGTAIHAAVTALHFQVGEAREVMSANQGEIEALAVAFKLPTEEPVEKFDRWRLQLAALERESDRLLKSMAEVAEIQAIVATAAALEQGIAETLSLPPGERNKAQPFVPVRQRCLDALAAIAGNLGPVREAHDSLAATRDAEWRILKTAPRLVRGLCSELAGLDKALHDTHVRIAAIHDQFKSDRARPR